MSPVVIGEVPPSELVRLVRELPRAIASASGKDGAVFLYLNGTAEWVENDGPPDGWPGDLR
ncbi:hypothetical protein [Spirillospora sp. CA-294931]|uniref:hypothetical protein n=1 Tax=Spirillospora sp. CA-294931 TaxID=3240042 RepID=UPI003D8AE3A1